MSEFRNSFIGTLRTLSTANAPAENTALAIRETPEPAASEQDCDVKEDPHPACDDVLTHAPSLKIPVEKSTWKNSAPQATGTNTAKPLGSRHINTASLLTNAKNPHNHD
ncbi:hypothetical protein TI39_contig4177g00001 [Zymoseptoria brevis]|uniref:Uncharacterized protein n=1 Tax=Zymoseptoria brevis TaxID=1047168 RepID=A0A0F4GC22_9PEZI|nr:hypothetical protein TI39_contig4177g00001 [Zymoseptoria brevis]